MSCLDTKKFTVLADQPQTVDLHIVDDVFVKSTRIAKKDSYIPQHAHAWDHLSVIASGSVRVWADGALLGDFAAPQGIVIKAGVKHMFLTLLDNTTVMCVHNVMRSGKIDVLEENSLFEVA